MVAIGYKFTESVLNWSEVVQTICYLVVGTWIQIQVSLRYYRVCLIPASNTPWPLLPHATDMWWSGRGIVSKDSANGRLKNAISSSDLLQEMLTSIDLLPSQKRACLLEHANCNHARHWLQID